MINTDLWAVVQVYKGKSRITHSGLTKDEAETTVRRRNSDAAKAYNGFIRETYYAQPQVVQPQAVQ